MCRSEEQNESYEIRTRESEDIRMFTILRWMPKSDALTTRPNSHLILDTTLVPDTSCKSSLAIRFHLFNWNNIHASFHFELLWSYWTIFQQ